MYINTGLHSQIEIVETVTFDSYMVKKKPKKNTNFYMVKLTIAEGFVKNKNSYYFISF